MIGDHFTCQNCRREVEKDEKIAIITKPKKLNGWTFLKSWGTDQIIYCSKCFGELD